MIATIMKHVRLNKKTNEAINDLFPNSTSFINKAVENYLNLCLIRINEPTGFAYIDNKHGVSECVRYYYTYYLEQQIVIIKFMKYTDYINGGHKNQPHFFCNHDEKFKIAIDEKLQIQKNENVIYIVEHIDHNSNSKYKTQLDFGTYNFNTHGWKPETLLTQEEIKEVMHLLDINYTHFALDRKAYLYEKLYDAKTEWDINLPLNRRLKTLTYGKKQITTKSILGVTYSKTETQG
jgi:hypothetical protein